MRKAEIIQFEWDDGNLDKSYQKHGITPNQVEEAFTDEEVIIVLDVVDSLGEKRLIAIGKTLDKLILFVVFTIRVSKIRIISSRRANQKERKKYEANKA